MTPRTYPKPPGGYYLICPICRHEEAAHFHRCNDPYCPERCGDCPSAICAEAFPGAEQAAWKALA